MLKGQEELGFEYPPIDPVLALHGGMQDVNNPRGSSCHTKNSNGEARLHGMIPEDGKRDPYDSTHIGHHKDLVEIQLEKVPNEKSRSPIRWKQKTLVDQQQNKCLENGKKLDEHIIEFVEPGILSHVRSDPIPLGKIYTKSYSSNHKEPTKKEEEKYVNKRVTIHYLGKHNTTLPKQNGKLIILPDSFEELLKIVGKHLLNNLKRRKT